MANRSRPDPQEAWIFSLFLSLFFASGFSALLYQVIWQRLLAFFGGADVYSVTIIVSAYMAGLGCGSLAGGVLADRVSRRGRFYAFVVSELAIASFALVSVPFYYDLLYARLGASVDSRLAIAGILFLTLLWPTFFMGMSLPLLSKALTSTSETAARRIGGLYGANTLGAAIGCAATMGVLARSYGFTTTVWIGAAVNLLCAFGALLLARRMPSEDRLAAAAVRPVAETSIARPALFSLPTWIALYALSGYVALSLEILWFRVLGVLIKSNAFTFSVLLAIFLSFVGTGTLVARPLAERSRRPAAVFLALQAAIPLYAGLSLTLLILGLGSASVLDVVWKHAAGYEGITVDVAAQKLWRLVSGRAISVEEEGPALRLVSVWGAVPLVLMGPPTLLMGMSFTFLQRTIQTELAFIGRRLGWLQTANIAGSLFGACFTGLFLLHFAGSAGTLKLLVLLGGLYWLLACRALFERSPILRVAALATGLIATGLLVWRSPTAEMLWAKLHATTPELILFGEDGSGVSVLKRTEPPPGSATVFVNGLGQSFLPFGGIHTQLGALGVMLHPRPATIAVIGLGSGDTVFATGGRPETERIDCLEIVGSELRTLRSFAEARGERGLTALLGDPRVHHTVADGRNFIKRSEQHYDLIEADALRPTSAYAGNLYSYEHFDLLRRRLNPGGLAVIWAPTPRTVQTFGSVFPHALSVGVILIGSSSPIPFDAAQARARLSVPFTNEYYRRAGIDIAETLAPYLDAAPEIVSDGSAGIAPSQASLQDLNRDLFPRDELFVAELLP